MSDLTRRHFLTATTGAAAAAGALRRTAAAGKEVTPLPQVPLGKTGITLSRLGQGTGAHGYDRKSNQTKKGFSAFLELIRHGYDRGITFFDLADLYGTHVYFREALKFLPREKITILSKLWWRYDSPPEKTPAEFQRSAAEAALERFRQEILTDYLDIVLLHCATTGTWDRDLRAYMDVLSEAKEKKIIRAVGVSCHDFGALETAAASPWVDVILARLNPKGVKMDGTPDEIVDVLRKARQNGKGIIGMKIYGEGKLANMKEECIRFAQNSGVLDTMTIGAETPEQLDETLRLIGRYPAKRLT
jgi:aryl-alcohol dehydrogenase-like predicted oxidoreductase